MPLVPGTFGGILVDCPGVGAGFGPTPAFGSVGLVVAPGPVPVVAPGPVPVVVPGAAPVVVPGAAPIVPVVVPVDPLVPAPPAPTEPPAPPPPPPPAPPPPPPPCAKASATLAVKAITVMRGRAFRVMIARLLLGFRVPNASEAGPFRCRQPTPSCQQLPHRQKSIRRTGVRAPAPSSPSRPVHPTGHGGRTARAKKAEPHPNGAAPEQCCWDG